MHNKVNAKIKQAIELFYKNKFSESDGDPHKMGQLIKFTLLLINPGGQSAKELRLNGVSITNSTTLSHAFHDLFSTTGPKLTWEIPYLNNGPSFQEIFKYLWPLKRKIPNSSPPIVIRCCLFLKNQINLKVLVQMEYLVILL